MSEPDVARVDATEQGGDAAVATPTRLVVTIVVGAVAALVIGLLVAWARSGGDDDAADLGTLLSQPVHAPEITLVDTDGQPFDLAERLTGQVTIVYLGYLNCPDACPITLAGGPSIAMRSSPAS